MLCIDEFAFLKFTRIEMRHLLLITVFGLACADADDDVSGGGTDTDGSGGDAGTAGQSDDTGGTGMLDDDSGGEDDSAGETSDEEVTCNPAPPYEPNDFEEDAYELPEFHTDCDEDSTLVGVLAGEGDVDWYSYRGDASSFLCLTDPTVAVVASGPVRVCQFADCVGEAMPDPQCPGASSKAISEGGRIGCCTEKDSEIPDLTMTWGCGSGDHLVYMRVDQGDAEVCTSYTLEYHL